MSTNDATLAPKLVWVARTGGIQSLYFQKPEYKELTAKTKKGARLQNFHRLLLLFESTAAIE
jgi:hypothetical protein